MSNPGHVFHTVGAMVHAVKPVDVIAEELWDHDDPDSAAEDIVEALEKAGWRLVFVPDADIAGTVERTC